MLRRISVSGFKSLDQFELGFNQGLNVIVGPNGSGKTNIINFLEFLSYLSRDSLLEAVGRSGGAGRIFRRNPLGSLTKKISFSVHGDGEYNDYRHNKNHRAAYDYSAEIQLSENNSSIYFNQQRLKISISPEGVKERPRIIDLEVLAVAEDQTKTIFHHLDKSVVSAAFSRHRDGETPPLNEIKNQIENFCGE